MLLHEYVGAAQHIPVDDGVWCDQMKIVETLSYVRSRRNNLSALEVDTLLQDSSEACQHEFSEDDGGVIHCGTNELEQVGMSGLSCHVHLPYEETDVVEKLGSNALTSEVSHSDRSPSQAPLQQAGFHFFEPPRGAGCSLWGTYI